MKLLEKSGGLSERVEKRDFLAKTDIVNLALNSKHQTTFG